VLFKERLEEIYRQIEEAKNKGGRNDSVTVVAVSKRFPVEDIKSAYAQSGHLVYGENRIQEALDKASDLKKTPMIQLHFIGHIQKNKVKYLKDNFELVHSVDSEKLADLMQKHFEQQNRVQDVLVQVNIAGDENKSGVSENKVYALIDKVQSMPNLALRGLMMMPPLVEDEEDNRKHFAAMKKLFDNINCEKNIGMDILSMGMSGDFQIAVEEGSTMVRIGTALFGEREY